MSISTTVDDAKSSGNSVEPDEPKAAIGALRSRIDEIDSAIIDLWRERAGISQQVGAQRVASGGTRLVLSREQQIIHKFHRELGPIGTQLAILALRAGRGTL